MENQIALDKIESNENLPKLSRPSERHLEREKRNKRKSKIFTIKNEEKHLQSNTEEIVNAIQVRDIFKDFEKSINSTNSNFYALESFESIQDENFQPNGDLRKIIKEIEENMIITPSNFTTGGCKASFSQRFKQRSENNDAYYSCKRFKI